jgi:RNA polymerase-binding transcription factor DksA
MLRDNDRSKTGDGSETGETDMVDAKAYEAVLRDRQREIYSRLKRIDNDLGRTRLADDDDRAIEGENDEVLEEFGQAGEAELRAIEAALDRIARGTFGTCVRCGGKISARRLAAVPHAALCEHCISGE